MCQSEVCSSRMAGTYVGALTEPPRLAVTDRSHSRRRTGGHTRPDRARRCPRPAASVGHRAVSRCRRRPSPCSPRMYWALSCARRSASSSTMWLSSCWMPSLSGIRRSTVAPPSPADSMRQRAGVDDPLPQPLGVGDVGDPGEPEVTAAAGQDALAEEQPVRGDHVVRRPPAQQRDGDGDQQQERRRARGRACRSMPCCCPAGITAMREGHRADDQQEPDDRPEDRQPVRVQVLDDLLVPGEQLVRIGHAPRMTQRSHAARRSRRAAVTARAGRLRRRVRPCPPAVATTSRPSQSTACATPSRVDPSGRETETVGPTVEDQAR